jgi:NADH-quinone oxidoreductase subunit J
MTGTAITIAFWIFAAIAVGLSLAVISVRDPLKSAFCLVGVFFAVAAEFLLLDARLLAVLQVLVYAGAIMVFIIFVIMLFNLRPEDIGQPRISAGKVAGVILAAALIVSAFIGGYQTIAIAPVDAGYGQVASVAELLYTKYAFAFEATSLLLLIAIIGSVVLVGKKKETRGVDR